MSDALQIPTDLLPADGQFGAGAVQDPDPWPRRARGDRLAADRHLAPAGAGEGDRRRVIDGMTALPGLPDGYQVVLGNGGATAFWDVACFGLIREKSQHLSFGEFFSAKFATSVKKAPWLADPSVIASDPVPRPDPVAEDGVDTYAWAHNETSTAVMAPIVRPAGIGDDDLVLVDATSSTGGLPVDLDEVDVCSFAPQKCFASDGGALGRADVTALHGPGRADRTERPLRPAVLRPADRDRQLVEKDRTCDAPSVAATVLMAEQLDWMNAHGGLAGMVERTTASSDALYGWAEKTSYTTPYVADPALRSLVIGTIDFDETIDADRIAATLRTNGIVDTEPYRKLGRNQLRVAMYPAIDASDVDALTHCIDHVVSSFGDSPRG